MYCVEYRVRLRSWRGSVFDLFLLLNAAEERWTKTPNRLYDNSDTHSQERTSKLASSWQRLQYFFFTVDNKSAAGGFGPKQKLDEFGSKQVLASTGDVRYHQFLEKGEDRRNSAYCIAILLPRPP